jgi:hypothetical protein
MVRSTSLRTCLKIVPIDDHAAYVHSGQIYGVATYASNSLLYDNGKSGDQHCVVEYVRSADAVLTKADYEKTPGCSFYHGARGSFDGAKSCPSRKTRLPVPTT